MFNDYKLIGNYKVIKKSIGKGSFSKIYKAYDKNNEIVAIKIIKKKNIKNEKLIQREISVLQSLDHNNIIKLLDVFATNNRYYLIFDYCEYGDLKNYMYHEHPNLNELEILNIMKQIKNGLQYLFNNKIVHRDLKPQNILITRKQIIKISDFGFAKIYNEGSMGQTICGSPLYMAPEILTYKNYTDLADLWSVGVIMYELLFKETPVKGENLYKLVNNLKKYNFNKHSMNITYSKQAVDLLDKLLKKEPKLRIRWQDFFNHDWFNEKIILEDPEEVEEDYIFLMDEDNLEINNSNYNNKNYNVTMSKNDFNIFDDYLDNPNSSIENDDKDFIMVKNKKISTIPRSMPKNRFTDMINSLRSSISFLFTSPNSI